MDSPLFSVVIPTYNRAECLRRALESLVSQTFKDFEVIVSDDGSNDNTREVVDSFKGKLNLEYIWNENWGGPARPRNNGIKVAKGEWICFLDSDDSWKPGKLEYVKKYTDNFDLVYHGLDLIKHEKKNKKALKSRIINLPVLDNLLINKNAIRNSGACVRKSIVIDIGGLNEDSYLVGVEDYDLWLKIAKITQRFKYIPLNLGEYYIEVDGANLTQNFEKQIQGIIKIYETHTQYLQPDSKYKAYATLNYSIAKLKYEEKKYKEAIQFCIKSLPHSIFQIKIKAVCHLGMSLFKIVLSRKSYS